MTKATAPASTMIGDELRRLRVAAGLTQLALSKLAGVTPQTIAHIEAGRIVFPGPDKLRHLADALGASYPRLALLVYDAWPEP